MINEDDPIELLRASGLNPLVIDENTTEEQFLRHMGRSLADVKITYLDSLEGYEHLPRYDHTALSAVNMCPTWGIVRYVLHKRFESNARDLALEAGSACHETFAACRLLQLYEQGLADHMHHHGKRIFGGDKWKAIWEQYDPDDAVEQQRLRVGLEAFYQSGYFDDPRDTRRTTENIEETLTHYITSYDWSKPVWVQDESDPTTRVGIEIHFNLLIEFPDYSIVYTGRLDGIHIGRTTKQLEAHENKTSSRITDAWIAGMDMTHQITGYHVARACFTGDANSTRAVALGSQIPLPRSGEYDGFTEHKTKRDMDNVKTWLLWIRHTHELIEQYKAQPVHAPRYTHSCNRYFRPCSFIPLCDAPLDDFADIVENEMIVDRWDPTNESHGD